MAAYTKALDGNHLLEVGMEGFYGDSSPERKQYNPGYQVGADFISTNLIAEVDFATIHAYPDIWLSSEGDGPQDSFVQRWMWSHWQDAVAVLKKPLVFAEFGKSEKDPGYSTAERDAYIDVIYGDIYRFARSGGAFAGGLVWQIVAEGMEPFYDGYEIILSRDAATGGVIARQSRLMTALGHAAAALHGRPVSEASDAARRRGPGVGQPKGKGRRRRGARPARRGGGDKMQEGEG